MITQRIDEELKKALKEKNEAASSALRNLKAAIKNTEIEKRAALSDDDVLNVIAKKVKQHRDSIESFRSGGRTDLVEREEAQMSILQGYLPKQMGEQELTSIVKRVIAGSNAGPGDFGKVMKEVVAEVRGQADGSIISKVVKENLK